MSNPIYEDAACIVRLTDILFIEKDQRDWEGAKGAITVIFKGSRWDVDHDCWGNILWLPAKSAKNLNAAYKQFIMQHHKNPEDEI